MTKNEDLISPQALVSYAIMIMAAFLATSTVLRTVMSGEIGSFAHGAMLVLSVAGALIFGAIFFWKLVRFDMRDIMTVSIGMAVLSPVIEGGYSMSNMIGFGISKLLDTLFALMVVVPAA